ncbi:unnamed protein product [Trichogramma brassicae]|uniref:Uncharacterized protein n=1 Tax=Trichogramma brassicae TaxID=86971 RepID=A0A6H5IT52_9HYME|nr:unnamed protein product [Trichogramma brassicae]
MEYAVQYALGRCIIATRGTRYSEQTTGTIVRHRRDLFPPRRSECPRGHPKQIEHLLWDACFHERRGLELVELVARSGYKHRVELSNDYHDLEEDKPEIVRALTPVHRALRVKDRRRRDKLLRELFEIYDDCRANYADEDSWTHFHAACVAGCREIVARFLKLGLDPNAPVLWSGDRPLHIAMAENRGEVVELLLRRGAQPNQLVRGDFVPLHAIHWKEESAVELARRFLEVCDELGQRVAIDIREAERGNTPLHIAMIHGGRADSIELLLRRGADPNRVNMAGSSLLQSCLERDDEQLLESFFRVNDELKQTVQVDAPNKSGQTPLQWAVRKLRPAAVKILLDHGADLASFRFPDRPSDFASRRWFHSDRNVRLTIAAGVLAVAESLQRGGYELDPTTIAKVFDWHGLYDKTKPAANLAEGWCADWVFAQEAKEITIKDGNRRLSLYDLIQLPAEEAAKLLTYEDYLRLARSKKLPERHGRACELHLCEKASRGFFRRWAETVCRDEIIHDTLTNKELRAIFFLGSQRREIHGFVKAISGYATTEVVVIGRYLFNCDGGFPEHTAVTVSSRPGRLCR